jgi:hypothetical protein
MAALTAVVVAAVVLAVVFTRGDGGTGKGGEVFLQAAGKTGPDPFTESTAADSSTAPVSPSPATEAPSNAVRGVDGGAPGLYGGSRKVSSCDVEKQIDYLDAAPEKNTAFASVAGVDVSDVPAYLRSLTPVQLRMDTRVTNHGYRDGAATGYQAVLQAGTAVLVDDHGVPRVRCACGNPLTPPVAQQGTPKRTGDSWPTYRSSNVVVVAPSTTVVNVFVIYDHDHDEWVARRRGDTGEHDHKTKPPKHHATPSVSVSTPLSPSSPSPCAPPAPGVTGKPAGSVSPCPSTSSSPTSNSPTSSPPTSPPSSSQSPSSVPPTTAPESSATSSLPPPLVSDSTTTTQSASRFDGTRSPML